jgi:hypothetical protein
MNLAQFLAGRLAKGIVVLFAIAVLNFFLIRAAPGDPAQVLAGEAGAADEQLLIQLRERFGLDQPLLTQLWVYLKGLSHLRSRLQLPPAAERAEPDPRSLAGDAAADRRRLHRLAGPGDH